MAVLPCSSYSSSFDSIAFMEIFFSLKRILFPSNIFFPLYSATTPFPVIELNFFGLWILIFLFFAPFMIASPRGCSEFFSAIAAYINTSFSFPFSIAYISVTSGFPFVNVPVLSKIIVSNL